MTRFGFAVACGLALISCANAFPEGDERATKVIDLTRETRANFVIVSDVSVAFEGMKPQNFVGVEFHSGVNHRIEDAYTRVVANCETQTGFRLLIPVTKRTEGKEAAVGVCGIGKRDNVQSTNWLGFISYKFGKAERVQVVDREFVRTYDVMPDGAIIRNVWRERDGKKKVAYSAVATTYCQQAIPRAVFTKASIEKSYLDSACN